MDVDPGAYVLPLGFLNYTTIRDEAHLNNVNHANTIAIARAIAVLSTY